MNRQNICLVEISQADYLLDETISSSSSHDRHTTQHPENSELDSNSDTEEVCMPDMNKILLRFGIDTSKLRTVSLKKYENEMLLTEVLTDNIGSPTISQRIKSLGRKAHYTKVKSNTHWLKDVTESNDVY